MGFLSLLIFFRLFGLASDELVSADVMMREQKVPLLGGSSSSIGGDSNDPRRASAWFYGQRPIVTCFNQSKNFGLPVEQTVQIAKKSIESWQKYFKLKKIGVGINANFLWAGRCKGGEDLRIYFGTGPIFGNLKDLRAVQKMSYPVAYVNKTYLSRDLSWSRGYVRFVSQGYYSNDEKRVFPDWSVNGALEKMMVHELGHILGFRHIDGTIMRQDVALGAFQERRPVVSIDQESELAFCESCEVRYVLDKGSANGTLLKKLGLSNSLEVIRKKRHFSLVDRGQTVPLGPQQLVEQTRRQVLVDNFQKGGKVEQAVFTLYSQLGKQPLVIEYNSLGESLLQLRVWSSGKAVALGQFLRKAKK